MKNQNRFATHSIFEIDGLDWLCQHLSTTPDKVFDDFNAPRGKRPMWLPKLIKKTTSTPTKSGRKVRLMAWWH